MNPRWVLFFWFLQPAPQLFGSPQQHVWYKFPGEYPTLGTSPGNTVCQLHYISYNLPLFSESQPNLVAKINYITIQHFVIWSCKFKIYLTYCVAKHHNFQSERVRTKISQYLCLIFIIYWSIQRLPKDPWICKLSIT